MLECGSIVGPVTGYGNNRTGLLEGGDEQEFIHGFCPCHHVKFLCSRDLLIKGE